MPFLTIRVNQPLWPSLLWNLSPLPPPEILCSLITGLLLNPWVRVENGFNGRPGWQQAPTGFQGGLEWEVFTGEMPNSDLSSVLSWTPAYLVLRSGPRDPSAAQPCCGAAVPSRLAQGPLLGTSPTLCRPLPLSSGAATIITSSSGLGWFLPQEEWSKTSESKKRSFH